MAGFVRVKGSGALSVVRVVLGLLWTMVAHAQPSNTSESGLRLSWTRSPEAETCPDTPSIEADVVRRLGSNPFTPGAQRSIDAQVSREGGTWKAVIEYREADGTLAGSRVVTSAAESCDSLAAAAALGISLIVRTSTPEPPKAPPTPPPSPPPAPCPPAKQIRAEVDARRHATVSGAGTLAFGVLPKAAFGGALLASIPVSRQFSAIASTVLLADVRVTGDSGEYAFGAAWGAVGACYDSTFGDRVTLSACASLELGSVHVAVFDPTPVGPGARLWAAGTVGPRLDWEPVESLHFTLGGELLVPFTRRSFDVKHANGSETVFEQPAVGALALLGVGVEP